MDAREGFKWLYEYEYTAQRLADSRSDLRQALAFIPTEGVKCKDMIDGLLEHCAELRAALLHLREVA